MAQPRRAIINARMREMDQQEVSTGIVLIQRAFVHAEVLVSRPQWTRMYYSEILLGIGVNAACIDVADSPNPPPGALISDTAPFDISTLADYDFR
jgi:hypothetical protein